MNKKNPSSLFNSYAYEISVMLARLAQRLEHRICNAMVIGSNPIAGFSRFIIYFGFFT
jgi:hypothetical protein